MDEHGVPIADWPSEGLSGAFQGANRPWAVGTPVPYARAATAAELRRPGREMGPGIGVAALALGAAGAVVFSVGVAAVALWPPATQLAGDVACGGFLLLLLGYAFGTVGRRSRAAWRTATAGRWCAVLTPAVWCVVVAIAEAVRGDGGSGACLATLVLYAAFVFCVTLMFDLMLGTG